MIPKILLLKEDGFNLILIDSYTDMKTAKMIVNSMQEQVQITNSVSGTYYLIPAQEIKIVRE